MPFLSSIMIKLRVDSLASMGVPREGNRLLEILSKSATPREPNLHLFLLLYYYIIIRLLCLGVLEENNTKEVGK